MVIVSVTEAKRRFDQLIDQVLAGEEVNMTRRGKAVVRIVRVAPDEGEAERDVSLLT